MDKLLKLLIHHVNTIDGRRGTANSLKELMLKERQAKLKKLSSKVPQNILIKDIHHFVMCRVMLMYHVMRARAKISYKSMIKTMPVV